MKKARSHSEYQIVDLYPAKQECEACQSSLKEAYRKTRWVVSLSGLLRVNSHILACQSEGCRQHRVKYRPAQEGALVLPHYTFALEVVARIGELRYREHQTVEEIAGELRQGGMSIAIKEVQLLSEVLLALVETCLKDDQEALKQLKEQGGIVLAIDGIQPEKGNETRWLLRDVLSQRVLLARNLLSNGSVEIGPLIREVKKLGVPLLGVLSDKQSSICVAVEKELPGVPHQLCQFHYLRDLAKPVCEAARKLKKQLKQKVRGIRAVERQVVHDADDEASTVRGYCIAVREGLRADGKYPLEPAGITLYEKLDKIRASLSRVIEKRGSKKLERLRVILETIQRQTKEYARLVVAWSWIHQLAHLQDLLRTASRMLGNRGEAEDAVQETYLRAWKFIHRFTPGTNIRAWLFKILFHVISHQRRKWLRFDCGWTAKDEAGWEATLIYQAPVTQHLTDQEIIAALGRLPAPFQAVLLLAVVEEFTYKESAEILQIPIGTVMSRLHRARKLLARKLNESTFA